MRTVNIHAAKTQLSRLVDAAAAGEEIIIAKAGKPLARLGPLVGPGTKRRLGILAGKLAYRRISTLRCRTRSSRHSKTADAGAARRHILLWALAEPRRLDGETRATIESSDTEVLFSAASIWEIAIKSGLAGTDFAFDAEEDHRSRA